MGLLLYTPAVVDYLAGSLADGHLGGPQDSIWTFSR